MATALAPEPVNASTQETPAIVRDALKRVTTIGTLPEITSQIIRTVEDAKSTASQLHKIVSHDPALVTRILKVVNSAFYGLPGQVGSIERAIVLLGLNAVKNIAVAASLGQLFRGVKLSESFTAKDLWTHCIAVGVTARELARQMKLPVADEAFLAGMIHDIGLLVHLQLSPEKLRQVCEAAASGQGEFCDIERQIIGIDHQQLGKGLAEQWRFPRSCQQVAGFHHQPGAAGDESQVLMTLVYVADTLCCQNGQGFNLTAKRQVIDDATLKSVGLERPVVDRVVEKLPELVKSAVAVCG